MIRSSGFRRASAYSYNGAEWVTITTLVTDKGQMVTVFSTSFYSSVGSRLKFKATVKDFTQFEGMNQTIVQRVKVIEETDDEEEFRNVQDYARSKHDLHHAMKTLVTQCLSDIDRRNEFISDYKEDLEKADDANQDFFNKLIRHEYDKILELRIIIEELKLFKHEKLEREIERFEMCKKQLVEAGFKDYEIPVVNENGLLLF